MVIVRAKPRTKKAIITNVKPKVRPVRVAAGSATSGMVVELRKRLQLNQAVFARLLPISVRSLASLESGSPPTDVVARRVIRASAA